MAAGGGIEYLGAFDICAKTREGKIKTQNNPIKEMRDIDFIGFWVAKRLGFSAAPRLFDALVGPLMRAGGLSTDRVPAHEGNVFVPLPLGDDVHGPWERRWLPRRLGAGRVVRLGHRLGLGGAPLPQVDRGPHDDGDGQELGLPVLE